MRMLHRLKSQHFCSTLHACHGCRLLATDSTLNTDEWQRQSRSESVKQSKKIGVFVCSAHKGRGLLVTAYFLEFLSMPLDNVLTRVIPLRSAFKLPRYKGPKCYDIWAVKNVFRSQRIWTARASLIIRCGQRPHRGV